MEFFPRWVLEKAIKEYKGDFHAKNLNTYSHCLHLMFGQMAGFEDLGMWLIHKVRPMYAKENIPDVYLPGWEIFAIDSTTIPCSIKLAEWALGKYSKGGVKMHTVLDLRGSIPDSIYITNSRYHDSNFLDEYEPYK